MEQLDYTLLYRWFVGLKMDDPMWDVTVFTKNRERLSHQGKGRSSTTSRSDTRFPTLASTTRKPQQREVTSGRSCALASPTFTEKWRVTC
jgi:hypothetical protein